MTIIKRMSGNPIGRSSRAFAKGLFSLCATLFISGALALLSRNGFVAAMLILAVGLVASVIVLFRVQKKYNRGLF